MSWILGSVTLPSPRGFRRRFIEKFVYHEMINGTTKKDITSRKEQFLLDFKKLPQATAAQVLSLLTRNETLMFSVEDGDLTIGSTEVHIDVAGRNYLTKGSEFREDFEIVLTEVS